MLSIIISPAKQIKISDFSPRPLTEPIFAHRAQELRAWLRGQSFDDLKKLWKVSDKLGQAAFDDLHRDLPPGQQGAALLSYDGIQYKYMAPDVFSETAIEYAHRHLRILSGLYGVLRPFDRIAPYRLELGTKAAPGDFRTLYAYWGSAMADSLEGDVIVNLASDEYSKAVLPHLKGRPHVTCVFAEEQQGKLIEKGVYVKMTRGRMVSFMAENQIEDPRDLRAFDEPGFVYRPDLSDRSRLVFVKVPLEIQPQFDFS